MINHQGTVYIFFNEMTVDSVKFFYENDRLLLPSETVVSVVTNDLSVILSSEGEIDLYNINDCGNTTCHATNPMIIASMNYLRNNMNEINNKSETIENNGYIEVNIGEYWINIFPFNALYMDSLLFNRNAKPGYIVITYNEIHWDKIELAYIISWILSGIMLFIGIILIIYNIKFHRAMYFKRQISKSIDNNSFRDRHQTETQSNDDWVEPNGIKKKDKKLEITFTNMDEKENESDQKEEEDPLLNTIPLKQSENNPSISSGKSDDNNNEIKEQVYLKVMYEQIQVHCHIFCAPFEVNI